MLNQAKEWYEGLSSSIQRWKEWDLLSDDQLIAVYEICSRKRDCLVLTGRAGSGKTFVAKLARKYLLRTGVQTFTAGVTGVASQNVQGEGTINKLLALGTGNKVPQGVVDLCRKGKRKSTVDCSKNAQFQGCKISQDCVFFIDEGGMMTSEMAVLVWEVLDILRRENKLNLVVFGDFRQLAPIAKQSSYVPYTMHFNWLFDNAVYQAANESTLRNYGSLIGDHGPFLINGTKSDWNSCSLSLITNHRQKEKDGWFINALNLLGDGENFSNPIVNKLVSRVFTKQGGKFEGKYVRSSDRVLYKEPRESIHVFHSNAKVAAWNKSKIQELIEKGANYREYPLEVTSFNKNWSVEDLTKSVEPIEHNQVLCVGCEFMVRQNINENLSNGTTGKIIELKENGIIIRTKDGAEYEVPMGNFPVPEKDGVPVGRVFGLPGHPAHALTPWKLQGLTLKIPVVYHLENSVWGSLHHGANLHGLMYVVCSRVVSPSLLYILADSYKLLNAACVCEEKVKSFISKSENKMRGYLGKKLEKPKLNISLTSSEINETKAVYHLFYDGSKYFVGYKEGEFSLCLKAEGTNWVSVDPELVFHFRSFLYEKGKLNRMWTKNKGGINIIDTTFPYIEKVEGELIADKPHVSIVKNGRVTILVIKNKDQMEDEFLASYDKFAWLSKTNAYVNIAC